MDSRRQQVAAALDSAVVGLESLLGGWGFKFEAVGVQVSHCGLFASGHFCRGTTRIGLSCRETIDNIYYERTFVLPLRFHKEIETFSIGHHALMQALGHAANCRLICVDDIPHAIVARDGGDRVAALLYDWEYIAAAVLREPNEHFDAIVRQGFRGYSVE